LSTAAPGAGDDAVIDVVALDVAAVDVAIIGGGIAGVSAACELAGAGCSVVLLEQEDQLAHHTTGRSAAVFLESYGPPTVRALTAASRADYDAAPDRFGTLPLLEPRSALWVAPERQVGLLDALVSEVPTLERLPARDAIERCSVLSEEYVVSAAVEHDAAAIDVLGLHQGYLRGLVQAGGAVVRSARVRTLDRVGAGWELSWNDGELSAGAVVLAAGAWCDSLAGLAGARPVGLRPLRRTIAVCRVPAGCALDPEGPLVSDAAHSWYFKPEGPNVLVSPADETLSEPCDARPEEADVALGIERVNEATTLGLRSVVSTWAGLRTFAPDGVPVVGEDPDRSGLFWLAGQGGYGIQTAPAMARCLAGLVTGSGVPPDIAALGVTAEDLSPARF
jgi:D-arginine dehydrogenase